MDAPPELMKAAAHAFAAAADHLSSGKALPGYLIALLAQVAIALGKGDKLLLEPPRHE